MPLSFNQIFAKLDAVYQKQPPFVALKARLMLCFNLVVLVFIPVNIAKLFWIQPPGLPVRFLCTLAFLAAALFSLLWVRKGRMDLAGNGVVLIMMLPVHGLLFFIPYYAEPLASAYQLFVFDLVCLLLALAFSGRKTVWTVLTVTLVSHFIFFTRELGTDVIPGSLNFAAGTLLRDGFFALGFIFCLGITLTILAEAAHRRSEESLNALRQLNENLEQLVAERTRELEAETRRANEASRAKGDFLANMSHEIRTPLNGILASTELLLTRKDLPADANETARIISEAGELLLRQVSDVLDFSKIESGQLDLEPHPFVMGQVIADMVALLSPQAALGRVKLTSSMPAHLAPAYEGDSFRLRQILLNLVANAIKFTPPGASVQLLVTPVESSANSARIRFEIRDSGIGIEESALKRIFERFSQADTSTSRNYGGSGLGLAISARLVKLMGGTLEAESIPGQGSTFHFTLALRALEKAPATVSVQASPLALLDLNVLVAEDNSINRKLLANQLEKLGCRYRMVGNGQEMLTALEQSPLPDVILTDCEMPDLDGREATKLLRAWAHKTNATEIQHRASVLPVIALTASTSTVGRSQCFEAGMTDYLSKPAKIADLQQMLQSVTKKSRTAITRPPNS